MRSDLDRRNDALFREVAVNTYRACAKRVRTAARVLTDELRSSMILASEHMVDLETIQAVERRRGAEDLQQSKAATGQIMLWNGQIIDCVLHDVSSSGARL